MRAESENILLLVLSNSDLPLFWAALRCGQVWAYRPYSNPELIGEFSDGL